MGSRRLRLSREVAQRGRGFGLRASPSNFTYNHIGHFAAADEAVCKAFRDFAFANAVRFFGGGNPRFFEGTVVEAAAAHVLAGG